MINYEFAYAVCRDDISTIENYELAIADQTQTWICHHKKGVDITREELVRLGLYYHQPSYDLIFVTKKEHNQIHKKRLFGDKKSKSERSKEMWKKRKEEGWTFSEESKEKMSKAHKELEPWNKGMPGHTKGKKRYTNGKIRIYAFECPEGFWEGWK